MRLKDAMKARIYQLCDDRQLSVNGLAKLSGVTQSTLNNIVSGRNNAANIATIKKMCDGLGMEVADFFDSDLFRNLEQEVV